MAKPEDWRLDTCTDQPGTALSEVAPGTIGDHVSLCGSTHTWTVINVVKEESVHAPSGWFIAWVIVKADDTLSMSARPVHLARAQARDLLDLLAGAE